MGKAWGYQGATVEGNYLWQGMQQKGFLQVVTSYEDWENRRRDYTEEEGRLRR